MLSSTLSSACAVALFAFSPLVAALPRPVAVEVSRTSLVPRSKTTPVAKLPPPKLMPAQAMRAMLTKMHSSNEPRSLGDDILEKRDDDLVRRATTSCIDSSANDTVISSLFHYGGAGTTVELCPGAVINLQNAIFFTAKQQVLTTQGNPSDDSRAKLIVQGSDQSVAIYAACQFCDDIVISNIQIDGSWRELGYNGGYGLIEAGGDNSGQTVKNCKLQYPRGWTALHGIEGDPVGDTRWCSSMQIYNNEVGPSGAGPTPGTVSGQWADGISVACKASTISGNTITDATDGGIVIFGAPGTHVSGNTITSATRGQLGGINAVDWAPWSGTFADVVVEGNTLVTSGHMMKVGIALGGMTWGSDNRTAARTHGGTFRNNIFKSSNDGYFGFGISVAGHIDAVVSGNDASGASFGGQASSWCVPSVLPPSPQAFIYDQYTTPGSDLENNFFQAPIVFAICQVEGSVVSTGASAATGMILVGQDPLPNASSSAVSSSTVSSSTVSSTTVASSSVISTTTVTLSTSTTTTSSSAPTTTTTTTTSSAAPVSSSAKSSPSTTSSAAPAVSNAAKPVRGKAFNAGAFSKWSLAIPPAGLPGRLLRRFSRETPSVHLTNPFGPDVRA
ncbi:hypothetical protein JCM8202_003413 [Rhodotorula sphaerocarpa]